MFRHRLLTRAAAAACTVALATAAPAAAAPRGDSPAHDNRSEVTSRQLAKEISRSVDGDVTFDAVAAVVESYQSNKSWERDLEFTATDTFSTEPGQVAISVADDGTVGFATTSADGGCTLTTIAADGTTQTWSWDDLGKNCSGDVALGGPDAEQPAWADPVPPAAPGTITAEPGDAEAHVSWPAPTDTDVVAVQVLIDGVVAATADVAAGTVTVADLTNAQTYTVTAAYVDEADNVSAPSEPVEVTPVDLTPPDAPADLTVEATADTATVSWTANTEADLAGYIIEVAGQLLVVDATETAVTVDGLDAAATYPVSVTAYDHAGNTSEPATGEFTTSDDGTGASGPGTFVPGEPAAGGIEGLYGINNAPVALAGDGSLYLANQTNQETRLGEHTLPRPASQAYYLAKRSPDGAWQWATPFGIGTTVTDLATTTDGGVVFVGSTRQQWGYPDEKIIGDVDNVGVSLQMVIGKVNADGTVAWVRTAGTTIGIYNDLHSISARPDGSFVVGGQTKPSSWYPAVFGDHTLTTAQGFFADIDADGVWQRVVPVRGTGYYGAAGVGKVQALAGGGTLVQGAARGAVIVGGENGIDAQKVLPFIDYYVSHPFSGVVDADGTARDFSRGVRYTATTGTTTVSVYGTQPTVVLDGDTYAYPEYSQVVVVDQQDGTRTVVPVPVGNAFTHVERAPDGGFLLAGPMRTSTWTLGDTTLRLPSTKSQVVLAKMSADGTFEWARMSEVYAYNVRDLTVDGSIVLTYDYGLRVGTGFDGHVIDATTTYGFGKAVVVLDLDGTVTAVR